MRRKSNPNIALFEKKKTVKKKTIKSLVREADRLLQLKYVPLNPKCFVCAGPTSEMHHFIYKSQSSYLRFDPMNLIPLCRRCHSRHHLSGDPSIVATILERKGFKWNEQLQAVKRKPIKLNKAYLEIIIDDLKL
jgi:5-methylcytosine-specific restriction endonuclease McrA